jgi:hypothetical protein
VTAKLQCVRYLWMQTFFQFLDYPEDVKKKYCHKRPALAASEGDTYFFDMQATLDEVNGRAPREDTEVLPATLTFNKNLVTHENSKELLPFKLSGGLQNIFNSNFWVDGTDKHPAPGTMISYSEVNNFIWMPVDHRQIADCRHVTSELEKKNLCLQISHYKRRVLIILHPQNDFCDRVPGLYPVEDIDIEGFEGTDVLSSIPTRYDGKAAYLRADIRSRETGRRRGAVHGFRTKTGNATTSDQYFVEVLWDAEVYKPHQLVVKGFSMAKSSARHLRRLKNACHNVLRVHSVSDTRDINSKRYGRLIRVNQTRVEVRWNLSVPCYVAKRMLRLAGCPEIEKGSLLDKKTVGGSECLADFSKDDAVCYRYSPTLEPCDDASIQMFGNGRVVKVCDDGTHVEVVWDAENTCGNLSVLGSYTDMSLTARLIRQNWDQFDEIIISRDCHRCNHISHKSYWRSKESDGVDDFQTITYMDILSGKFTPAQSEFAVGLKMPFAKFHRIIVDALAGSCS